MNFLRTSTIATMVLAACVFGAFPTAHAGTLPDISGTWYAQGNGSKPCHIAQSGNNATFTNEVGDRATGRFTDPSTLSTSWPDWHNEHNAGPRSTYIGRISSGLTTIHWSNGTYWTRHPH